MITAVGVVGAGQMGSGIAQVAAQAGYSVFVSDVSPDALKKGEATVAGSLTKFVEKGKLSSDDASSIQKRIRWSDSLASLNDAQFVIEAATENEALKKKIFANLDSQLGSHVILASNTSSISITRLAAATKRADRFIGMHFMNPVPLMKLVEIICGLSTSEETLATVRSVAEKMGKITTRSADYPGFIANRILMPMINEAFFALMEGLAKAEDIDITMQLGTNHPMGPLKLADFIGLDTCLAIMEVLHEGMGDDKYRPCPLLRQYVDAGLVGKKVGRGVYTYGI